MPADAAGFLALVCESPACGLRYPSPADDARFGTCPACESPASPAARYWPPHEPTGGPDAGGELVAVLDSIRSALNVGTILRTADGARVSQVHLCGLTADVDNPKVIKTALGAEQAVATSWSPDVVECVEGLRAQGFAIWAVESTPSSKPIDELDAIDLPARVALVVGNERAGVDPDVLVGADRHVHVTMAGAKTSLNVGVAFGAVVYGIASARRR